MIEASGSTSRPHVGSEPFLVLRENRLAFAALERLARKHPRQPASLVYLYGPSGVGKSHLARHFLREVRQAEPTLKTAAVTASEFAAQLAEASVAERVPQFQDQYRSLDVLVCEDVQIIGPRGESQRQLVLVLDEITKSGGRVLLTADRLPGEIRAATPRLVSRCHGGLCVGIALPGKSSRASLLTHVAGSRQIAVTPEAVRALAEARPVSPRELSALLVQLEASARIEKARLDVEFVRRFLAGDVAPPTFTLTDIARAVARHFRVRVSDLRSPTRSQGVAVPRQCAMYLGRRHTGEPLTRIAAYFGRRNHSAVIHACRRTDDSLADQPVLRQHLAQIRTSLGVTSDPSDGDE